MDGRLQFFHLGKHDRFKWNLTIAVKYVPIVKMEDIFPSLAHPSIDLAVVNSQVFTYKHTQQKSHYYI